ncbi:MAG TPA: ELWxxDGT repeat protein, partial [Parafilimonas sp.]|nr:ELWxxDGT repeat protein [Parafilimonas sp.]
MSVPKPLVFLCVALVASIQIFAQNQAIHQHKNFSTKKGSFNFTGDGFSLSYDSTTGQCEILSSGFKPRQLAQTNEQRSAIEATTGLTYLVKDIDKDKDSYPQDNEFNTFNWYYAVLDNVIYFAADDGIHGSELWRSDGTDSGTYIVADINAGNEGSSPTNIIVSGNKIFFAATTPSRGQELWVSDGTEAGTKLVRDILSQSQSSYPEAITNVNGIAYFLVSLAHYHDQLWKSDGTQGGTTMVKDLYLNGLSGGIYQFTAANNLLFFTAGSASTGQELWRSDGSESGTFMVSDIDPGSGASYPAQLTFFNNRLYFSAFDGANRLLWETDGGSGGTHPVSGNNNIQLPGGFTLPFVIGPFAISNNALCFMGYAASTGWELYKYSDSAGVVLVADILPGTQGYYMSTSYRPEMADLAGSLFFRYKDSAANNYQLWTSTTSGTKKIRAFDNGSFFNNLVNGKTVLYFIAFDSTYGTELWKSNGKTSGTVPIDVYPGSTSSNALYLTLVGNKLFFSGAS